MPHDRAIFLDKDGTIVVDVPYNVDPEKMVLAPGVASGLRRLAEAGYKFAVVSNQSGVAHGYFSEQDLPGVERRLHELLAPHDVKIAGFYYCPHHPEGRESNYRAICDCRKPKAGLILQAAEELQLDCSRSWMIGDILDDVEAGHRAGCRSVLIDNGGESQWRSGEGRTPEYRALDMDEAARWILQADKGAAQSGNASAGANSAPQNSESEEARVPKSV